MWPKQIGLLRRYPTLSKIWTNVNSLLHCCFLLTFAGSWPNLCRSSSDQDSTEGVGGCSVPSVVLIAASP